MARYHKPRAGSKAYSPRKRAKKSVPRVRSWPASSEVKPLGFVGYKAGMTHVLALDGNKNSPTANLEVFLPVTVIDAPPLKVVGVRVYADGYFGKKTAGDVIIQAETKKKSKKKDDKAPEKSQDSSKKLDELVEQAVDLTLIAETQPSQTSLAKKRPDRVEIAIGGTVEEKAAFARENLGKEITAESIFEANQAVDVKAVTKGKGFAGVIKRWGTSKQPRKSTKKRRHVGSGGSWTPARKLWFEPLPGQMGYQTRTDYNKTVLSLGADGGKVTPAGGFLRYGSVKGNYILLAGSVPGPSKRAIRLTIPRRTHRQSSYEIVHIDVTSKQGA